MLADAAFVLPADVLVVPIARLSPEFARLGQAEDDDFAVTRPLGRAPSCVIDKRFAAFLAEFRTPRKIAAAIVDYARRHEIDSGTLLDAALPLLARLVDAGFLIHADARLRPRQPVRAGDAIGPFRVVSLASIMNDTEVYAVACSDGDIAALKITVAPPAAGAVRSLDHEAAVLERLDGRFNPRLRCAGDIDEHPYLLLDWCAGEPVVAAAERARATAGLAGARKLAVRVLDAFAHLHAQGVVHGDVHPGNVLCARGTSIAIVDFGLAVAAGLRPPGPRGGVGFFFEPEFVDSRGTMAATARGEQYALAALVFAILTGQTYLDFSLEQETAFHQIATQAPRAFSACGSPAWPAGEAILSRALAKDPLARFDSLTAFARALADAPLPPAAPNRGRIADLRGYAASALSLVSVGSPFLRDGVPEAPTVSVTFGAAGIALACLRMACVGDDPALFALAELWSERATIEAAGTAAFRCERLGITSAAVGAISPYHTASGLHAVTFLVAAAGGDLVRADRALREFIAACSAPCDGLDVMLGMSGVLVVAATLLDAIPPAAMANRERLLAFGDSIACDVWKRLAGFTEIGSATELTALGTAHGWAGVLYAGVIWSLAAGRPLPAAARMRLDQLAAQRIPRGSGARWPIACRNDLRTHFATSWCSGTAGHVFTWTAAYQALGDGRFLELAEAAAWNVWEGSRESGNLCCGDAGAAYALLNLFRIGGDVRWRQRAERLAYRAIDVVGGIDHAQPGLHGQSLFKGALGIAVLAADLAEPQRARLPLFEPDAYTVRETSSSASLSLPR